MSEAIITAEQIKLWTEKDPTLSRIYRQVQLGWPLTESTKELEPYCCRKNELSVLKGCILWGSRVVISVPGRAIILDQLHETHPGISRMKALARSFIWWPGLDLSIEEKVRHCEQCQLHRPMPAKAPIHPWEWPNRPWARIHIDHAGPYLGKMFLIIVDSHSKWIDAHIFNSTSSENTIAVLRSVFAIHGMPEQLVSDNGSGFTSNEFKEFTGRNGIHHTFTSLYHPSSNGLAERAVQTVKKGISMLTGSIQMRINQFLLTYRITPQSSTGVSPSKLLMGRRIRTCLDRVFPDVGRTVLSSQERQQRRIPTQRVVRHFQTGERVYARNFKEEM